MISLADLCGGQSWKMQIPLFGNGTSIAKGAAVQRGATGGTNQGYGVIGSSTYNNFIGVTEAAFAAATTDNDPSAGTKYILTDVLVAPDGVWAADYDTSFGANALTIASMSATPGNPTVTSLEDIGGGWLLGDDGFLSYVESVSTGAATLKSAASWVAGTNKVIKIMHLFAPKIDLTTAATKIKGNTAAQGSGLVRVLGNFMRAIGFDQVALDPTKHSGITVSSIATAQFYAHVKFETTVFNSAN